MRWKHSVNLHNTFSHLPSFQAPVIFDTNNDLSDSEINNPHWIGFWAQTHSLRNPSVYSDELRNISPAQIFVHGGPASYHLCVLGMLLILLGPLFLLFKKTILNAHTGFSVCIFFPSKDCANIMLAMNRHVINTSTLWCHSQGQL